MAEVTGSKQEARDVKDWKEDALTRLLFSFRAAMYSDADFYVRGEERHSNANIPDAVVMVAAALKPIDQSLERIALALEDLSEVMMDRAESILGQVEY